MSFKIDRIKKLLKKEIMNCIVSGGVKDPRIPHFFSITKITLSKDLHYAHIYISVLGQENEKEQALAGLNSARGVFQKYIAAHIKMKYTPKLEFRYDKYEEEAYRVDHLLKKISRQNSDEEKNSNLKNEQP